MSKKKTTKRQPAKQQPTPEPTKQMKLWLTVSEHTIVNMAAAMTGTSIKEYMRQAVIQQARKDAKGFGKMEDII